MPDEPLTAPDVNRQRDNARRSLLRANTAVAFVLVAVLTLAGIAAVGSIRARQHQHRAETAQAEARSELWRAYLADIRAIRQDRTLGRRPAALEVIRRATAMAPSVELRNEAVATLALPDFKIEADYPAEPSLAGYAFDRQLRWFAQSRTNGDIIISSVPDGKEVARLRLADGELPLNQEAAALLEFSPDGTKLSTRYRGGALAVWDWQKGRTIFRHDDDKQRRVASRGRFSADGRFIVGPVFTPMDGTAVFEIETGRQVALFPEISSFRHVAVRPGATMFAANDGTNVVVVDWQTRRHVAALPFEAGVRFLAWSPDGRQLAIVGNLLEVHVWDFERRQRRVLTGHKNDIWCVVFDPRGDRLATSSHDGTARLWDLRDGRLIGATSVGSIMQWSEGDRLMLEKPDFAFEIRRFVPSPVHRDLVGPPNVSQALALDISADGEWAVSEAGRGAFQVWNLSTSGGPQLHPVEWLRSVGFHPVESRIWITKRGGPEWREFTVMTNGSQPALAWSEAMPMRLVKNAGINLLTSTVGGETLAYVELAGGRAWTERVGSGKPVPIGSNPHDSVSVQSSSPRGSGTMSLSPDGRWLAIGAGGIRKTALYDALSGQLVRQLARHSASVQFSPDGRWLVVAQRSSCRLFRGPDWSQAWEVDIQRIEQPAAAFSPDGERLAVVSSPHSATLFESATGRELAQLQSPDPAPVINLRWSADGRRLVAATRENHVGVWEMGALRRELVALGLDWNSPALGLASIPRPGAPPGGAGVALGIFTTVGMIALVALLGLRRHRGLIEKFARTEALAEKRSRQLRMEREISELKGSFVSMVSHEFRTPLGVIQSSAQILGRYLDRLPPEQRREQVESITKNVRRMSNLIEEVLLLGKAEGGQMTCSPAPLDLPVFCRRLADEMLAATHHHCPIDLAEGALPPARGDEDLLRHILSNLLSNAVKYSPAGKSVRFTVGRDGEDAVFEIRDEGLGIPAADQEKLFSAFHRGGNVSHISGTGLGLTIVKRCVEVHKGSIDCVSELGRGTTFTVRLPLFDDSADAAGSPGAEENRS